MIDTGFVEPKQSVDARQKALPIYQSVMQEIGRPIVFNICMLGVVLGLIDLVKPKSVMKILETQIPRTFLEINRKALHLGMKLAAGNQN